VAPHHQTLARAGHLLARLHHSIGSKWVLRKREQLSRSQPLSLVGTLFYWPEAVCGRVWAPQSVGVLPPRTQSGGGLFVWARPVRFLTNGGQLGGRNLLAPARAEVGKLRPPLEAQKRREEVPSGGGCLTGPVEPKGAHCSLWWRRSSRVRRPARSSQ